MNESDKLFERMLKSRFGWKEQDVERLYLGFGFRIDERTRHRKYWHPRHPELFAIVPRHRDVKAVYIAYAVRLIKQLKEMEEPNG